MDFALRPLLLAVLLAPAAAGAQPEALVIPPWLDGARLGIRVLPMSPALRDHLKVPGDLGVLVEEVEPGSPAAAAGIRVGDVVTHVDGLAVRVPLQLFDPVSRAEENERLTLRLVRDGETLELDVRPRGRAWPDPEAWRERLLRERPGIDALQRRVDELERRLRDLERRLGELERRPPEPRAT